MQDTKKISSEKEKRITHFLKAIPYLDLSDTGYRNISKRFGIEVESLKALVSQERKARMKGGDNV